MVVSDVAPVVSNVAAPSTVGVRKQHEARGGPLSIFEVAIGQVDCEATAGIQGLLYCSIGRARSIAEAACQKPVSPEAM